MTAHNCRRRVAAVATMLSIAAIAFGSWRIHQQVKPSPSGSYRQIRWSDLTPRGWEQFQHLREFKVDGLRDGDPRAQQLLADMRAAWDSAPTVVALNGSAVQVAGYVVPLEGDSLGLTELLLFPYEGACIHTPPPPANQIIHVFLVRPVRGLRMMDNVKVRGVINARRESTFRAVSGYELSEAITERLEVTATAR